MRETCRRLSACVCICGRVHQKNKDCVIELSGLPICFTGRYITAVKIISLLKVI